MISVIIPVYNTENYLSQCIESVLNQTYSDLEILIIDDGSTDNSPQICDKYSVKDNRIKVWHRDNFGVSASRNFALEKSRGEWISFIDSDDWLNKDMFQILINLSEKYNSDTICCGHYDFNKGQYNIERTWRYYDEDEFISAQGEIYTDILCRSPFLWDKLLDGNSARMCSFDEDIRYGEDLLFLAKYFLNINKVAGTKTPLYYYRKYREGNTVSADINEKYMDYFIATERVIDIFHSYHEDYASILRTVQVIVKVLSRISLREIKHNTEYFEKAKTLSEKVKVYENILKSNMNIENTARKIMLITSRHSKWLADIVAKTINRIQERD